MDILTAKQVMFTDEDVNSFYHHRQEEAKFGQILIYITSGPSLVMVLSNGETGEIF